MNHHARRPDAGFNLLEISVALMMLIGVYAAVFELLVNSRRMDAQAAATDEQAIDSGVITRAISLDLAMSGWYFEDAAVTAGSLQDPAQDRNLYYFPYVTMQAVGSRTEALPNAMPWAARAESQVRLPWTASLVNLMRPTTLAGATLDSVYAEQLTASYPGTAAQQEQAYQRSFSARSQELIFLRGTIASWDHRSEQDPMYDRSLWETEHLAGKRPSEQNAPTMSFAGPVSQWKTPGDPAGTSTLFASGFMRDGTTGFVERTPGVPYGRVLDAGWYDADATGGSNDSPIKVQWETIAPPTYSAADYARTNLREFMYAVVPSPRGFGRLVRAYKIDNATTGYATGTEVGQVLSVRDPSAAGTYRMRVDRILSEDVARIMFDTSRTVSGLANNQIRVRLFLARASTADGNLVVRRMVEQTYAMRARSSSGEVAAIQDILGTTVPGLNR